MGSSRTLKIFSALLLLTSLGSLEAKAGAAGSAFKASKEAAEVAKFVKAAKHESPLWFADGAQVRRMKGKTEILKSSGEIKELAQVDDIAFSLKPYQQNQSEIEKALQNPKLKIERKMSDGKQTDFICEEVHVEGEHNLLRETKHNASTGGLESYHLQSLYADIDFQKTGNGAYHLQMMSEVPDTVHKTHRNLVTLDQELKIESPRIVRNVTIDESKVRIEHTNPQTGEFGAIEIKLPSKMNYSNSSPGTGLPKASGVQ